MVRAIAWGLAGLLAIARASAADGPAPDPSRSVGSALGKGSFPWYDAPKDAVRSIRVPVGRDWSPTNTDSAPGRSKVRPPGAGSWSFGNLVGTSTLVLALGALIGLLAWLWRMYEPSAEAELASKADREGDPSRIEELPAGLRQGFDPSDPWSEAIRRRDRGDLAGAIVCLFAHQLLTLSRLGLVRLAPGRTGRQLLRAVTDPEFRALVAPTLRLFEAAYYGHHAPPIEDFEAAWAGAEAFERRVGAGAAR